MPDQYNSGQPVPESQPKKTPHGAGSFRCLFMCLEDCGQRNPERKQVRAHNQQPDGFNDQPEHGFHGLWSPDLACKRFSFKSGAGVQAGTLAPAPPEL